MHSWTVADILRDTQGSLWQGHPARPVGGISIDSRTVQAGELFVALRGERFDGHQFVAEALHKGAAAILVAETRCLTDTADLGTANAPAVVQVPDTLVALQALACAHRSRFQGQVVAITGSNGKTTVKEMTAAVLQRRYATFKASGNLNNHIGLPLTMLRMALTHEAAVFELGMNHLGEIRHLGAMVRPHIGVITNIGLAHVGYLGSIEAIQQAKGELLESLEATGVAIVNADDPRALALGQHAPGRVISFGQHPSAEVRGRLDADLGLKGLQCTLWLEEEERHVRLRTPGMHNLPNALAAAAVGMALHVPPADVVAGLQDYHGMYGRLAVCQGRGGVTVIDDTYNANPNSVRAALQFLGHLPIAGQRLVVLGDMLELGEAAPALHQQVGAQAAASQVQHLITLGAFAHDLADGARHAGMLPAQIHVAADQQEVLALVQRLRRPGDVILLKGSRGMAMEHLVHALVGDVGGH